MKPPVLLDLYSIIAWKSKGMATSEIIENFYVKDSGQKSPMYDQKPCYRIILFKITKPSW